MQEVREGFDLPKCGGARQHNGLDPEVEVVSLLDGGLQTWCPFDLEKLEG